MSTHDPHEESRTTYRQTDLTGEVINDSSKHNRPRHGDEQSTETVDVSGLLNGLDSPRRNNHTNPANAVEKVRAWCVRRGFPLSEFRIYEHPKYGTVQIEKTGYVDTDEWDRIRSIYRETDGIGYDGDVNYCHPEWVTDLPAGNLSVQSNVSGTDAKPESASLETDEGDSFPCPVAGCGEGFGNVDALAGHIGGKAPYDAAHDDYGEISRNELLGQGKRP